MTTPAVSPIARTAASDAVTGLGWRYLYACLGTSVRVSSAHEAHELVGELVTAFGDDFDAHLRVDLRPGVVELRLTTASIGNVTSRDVALAGEISAVVTKFGLETRPATSHGVQTFEIAIDAIDIPAIRPFWLAVMGYEDDQQGSGPSNALVDPLWQAPSIWFQQMDALREQRNRIHFDLSVAHDEAAGRIEAAVAAGGRVIDAEAAPSFWVLADPEGNEICLCTWQGRDRD